MGKGADRVGEYAKNIASATDGAMDHYDSLRKGVEGKAAVHGAYGGSVGAVPAVKAVEGLGRTKAASGAIKNVFNKMRMVKLSSREYRIINLSSNLDSIINFDWKDQLFSKQGGKIAGAIGNSAAKYGAIGAAGGAVAQARRHAGLRRRGP